VYALASRFLNFDVGGVLLRGKYIVPALRARQPDVGLLHIGARTNDLIYALLALWSSGDDFHRLTISISTDWMSHKRPFMRQILGVSQTMAPGFKYCLFTRLIINVSYLDI
jgi:hypothetical protein